MDDINKGLETLQVHSVKAQTTEARMDLIGMVGFSTAGVLTMF
jgi:hypothetical protein